MTLAAAPGAGRLTAWNNRVLLLAAVLSAPLAGVAPLGFAALTALCGVLALPGMRFEPRHLPAVVPALVLMAWAAISALWTPYRPDRVEEWMAVKLIAEGVVFWSAVRLAAGASEEGRRLALVAFAWAMAIAGLFMVEEALSGAWVYQQLRELTGDPTRPDLAAKNVAQGAFALALLTPSAAVGGWRAGAPWALGLVMVAGVVAAGVAFDTDAPLLALVVAVAAGGLAMRWPTAGPVTLAVLAVVFWLSGPTLVLLAKAGGLWDPIQAAAPLSWSQRMDYWSNAVRLIAEHPIRGWGMEASRTFAPAIKLHPHDASLQVWLELGAVGALCVAAFWTAILMRLRRDRPDAAVAAGVASAAVYLLFAAVSFGVWQEWLVALGALAAVFAFAAELTPRRIDRRE